MITDIIELNPLDKSDKIKILFKPTQSFPEGYNYCYVSSEALSCIGKDLSYRLEYKADSDSIRVRSSSGAYLHRVLINPDNLPYDTDHISLLPRDNTRDNLRLLSHSENSLNKIVKGYRYNGKFIVSIVVSGQIYSVSTSNEVEACEAYREYRKKALAENNMKDPFDFLRVRKDDLDIVEREYEGIITKEEAIREHLLRNNSIQNYIKYDLKEVYKDLNIPIPACHLDDRGFII